MMQTSKNHTEFTLNFLNFYHLPNWPYYAVKLLIYSCHSKCVSSFDCNFVVANCTKLTWMGKYDKYDKRVIYPAVAYFLYNREQQDTGNNIDCKLHKMLNENCNGQF